MAVRSGKSDIVQHPTAAPACDMDRLEYSSREDEKNLGTVAFVPRFFSPSLTRTPADQNHRAERRLPQGDFAVVITSVIR
jgi:hypothetical protein